LPTKREVLRKIYLSQAAIILLLLNVEIPAQINDETKKISLVEVHVPFTEVYDDGIYRKLYSSFQVFDEKGNKVVGLSQRYDYPAKIELSQGKYTFIVSLSNGELIKKEVQVLGNQFEVIRIE
jgi:hypothetical protein